jgi:hypothetical protein
VCDVSLLALAESLRQLSNCINFYVLKVISVEYTAVCCGDGNFPEKSY